MLAALIANLPQDGGSGRVPEVLPLREPSDLELQILREEEEIIVLLMDLIKWP